MAESIKYKKPDTYHDAGNVYDSNQGKTQEQINESLNVKDVSLTFSSKCTKGLEDTNYCKKVGNIAIVSLQVHITDRVDAYESFATVSVLPIGKILTRLNGTQVMALETANNFTAICLTEAKSDVWLDGQIIIPINT